MKVHLLKKSSWILFILLFFGCEGFSQISGKIFKDLNSDGVQNLPLEVGLANYTVHVYLPGSSSPLSTITNSSGLFLFTASQVPSGTYVRVEYPDLKEQNVSLLGPDNRSNIQFLRAGLATFSSVGVINATDFCNLGGLEILTPCYVNGDPLIPGGSAGQDVALVKFPYNADGLAGQNGSPYPSMLATASQVGSVWGTSYQRRGQIFLVSALVRRHSGLGPLGTGGIYKMDDTNGNVSNFIDVKTLGIDTGPVPHSTLTGDKLIPNTDPNTIPMTGKSGIGGMTLSGDEKTLFFVNLYDRKLYSFYVGIPASSSNISNVKSYTIPNGCGSGDFRPWGITEKQGIIYVGTVCSAENSQNFSELKGMVYRMDPATENFTQIFEFPLTYQKGISDVSQNCPQYNEWYPWSDTFPAPCANFYDVSRQKYAGFVMYPQPILSGLGFDVDGSLIIGIMDRFGLAAGYRNMAPSDDGKLYDGFVGGDLLRAQFNPLTNTYTMESNGKSGDLTGCGVNNGEGPGGGEFFCEDVWYLQGNPAHSEITNGAVLILPSDGSIISSAMDPVNEIWQSGGLRTYNRENGALKRGYALYSDVPGTLGKSGGTGDFKATCDPAPIEIGNRVWKDLDFDGIQDPEEPGLAGVELALYDITAGNILVGTITTNTAGEYKFNNSNVTGGLKYENSYEVRMNISQGAITSLGKVEISPSNTGSGSLADMRDSDANMIGTQATITVNTGYAGVTNYSLDFGVTVCTPYIPSVSITQPTCNTKSGAIEISTPVGGQYLYSIDTLNFTTTRIFSNVISGAYNIMVKDTFGCKSQVVNVTIDPVPANPTKPILTISQPSCSISTGIISVVSPLSAGMVYGLDTLNMTNTTGVFGGLLPGTYAIYAKNSLGCLSDSAQVRVNPQPTSPTKPVLNIFQPTCTISTGSILVSAPLGSGLSYSMDGINFSNTSGGFNGLGAGNYTIWVKNNLGCTDTTKAVILSQPSSPSVPILTAVHPTCQTGTGSITVSWPLGAGLSYSIDGLMFTNATGIFNNLPSGTYTVWVRNSAGCVNSAQTTINPQPNTPAKAILNITQPTCLTSTGTITVNSPIGSGFSYSLDGSTFVANPVFSNLAPGTYNVTVRNSSNCISVSDNAILTAAVIPTNTTAASNSPLNIGETLLLTANGINAISYSWSGPGGFTSALQNPNITSSKLTNSGVYTVTVTSTSGCTATATTSVSFLSALGDYAWFDLNRNGKQDERKSPLGTILGPELAAGEVIFELYRSDNTFVAKDTSDLNGFYSFKNLNPGTYYVKVDTASFPDVGFQLTKVVAVANDTLDSDFKLTDFKTRDITLPQGITENKLDLGIYRYARPTIADPCACDTTIIFVKGDSYLYKERVDVKATPGGQWMVIPKNLSNGVTTYGVIIDDGNGNFKEINPNTENYFLIEDSPGVYHMDFGHFSDFGYALVVTDGTDTLDIGAICYETREQFDTRLEVLCALDAPINLQTQFPLGDAHYYFLADSAYNMLPNFNQDSIVQKAILRGEITTLNPRDYPANSTISLYVKWVPDGTTVKGSACPKSLFLNVKLELQGNCLSEIGDLVWEDKNKNGIQEITENPMPNVPITLLDSLGNTVTQDSYGNSLLGVVSNASGKYSFKNLNPGKYKVKFTKPTDYKVTASNLSLGLDTTNSDADTLTGVTPLITLMPGEINHSVDAGYYFDEVNCTKPTKPILSVTQPNCLDSTGSITILSPKVSGYTYSLNGIKFTDTTGIFDELRSGNYNIWVKNALGCVSEFTSAVINPQPMTPSKPVLSILQPTCTVNTGRISVTTPVGIGLTYSLDKINFTNTTGIFSNLSAGTYSIWVKGASGCISDSSKATIITAPIKPNAGLDQSITLPVNTVQLNGSPTGGTWSSALANLSSSLVSNIGVVSGLNKSGEYQYIYTLGACSDTVKVKVLCTKPTLTVGNIICNGSTYTVGFYSSSNNITANAGVVSADKIINIPIGTNLIVKASYGIDCETTLTVNSPVSCNPSCTLPNLTVGQPICKGNTYSVSYKLDMGTISVNAGTIFADSIVNIPIGTNLLITATSATGGSNCKVSITVVSPVSCLDDCTNPGVSVSGPICTSNGFYDVNFTKETNVSISTNFGSIVGSNIRNIPIGSSLVITITKPGCTTRQITVNSPSNCNVPCKVICVPVAVRKFK